MKAIALKIQNYFLALTGPLGGWALLLIALFDSSFLSLPEVNDILIITLSIKNPERMLYYCTMTTLGSILGCLALFTVGRKGGQVLLRKKFAQHKIETVARWYTEVRDPSRDDSLHPAATHAIQNLCFVCRRFSHRRRKVHLCCNCRPRLSLFPRRDFWRSNTERRRRITCTRIIPILHSAWLR